VEGEGRGHVHQRPQEDKDRAGVLERVGYIQDHTRRKQHGYGIRELLDGMHLFIMKKSILLYISQITAANDGAAADQHAGSYAIQYGHNNTRNGIIL
jgi:hypothetical protein